MVDPQSLSEVLMRKESYVEFRDDMLPMGMSASCLISIFEDLAPTMLIVHGSKVSSVKFSVKQISDLDIICVTVKAAFWPLKDLFATIRSKTAKVPIVLDTSIVTGNQLLSSISGNSSLWASLENGFSIILTVEK